MHIVQSIVIFVNIRGRKPGSQSRTHELRHGHSARDGSGVVTEGAESALCESFETDDVGETAVNGHFCKRRELMDVEASEH